MPWRGRRNDARTAFQRRVQRRGRRVSTTRPGRLTTARQRRPAKPSETASATGPRGPPRRTRAPTTDARGPRWASPAPRTTSASTRCSRRRTTSSGRGAAAADRRASPDGGPYSLVGSTTRSTTRLSRTVGSTTRAPRPVGSTTPPAASSNSDPSPTTCATWPRRHRPTFQRCVVEITVRGDRVGSPTFAVTR